MQIEGTKLIFIMNFSVLDFFKFASRMPQIAQIRLVTTFKIYQGREGGRPPPPPPPTSLEISSFFLFAVPGSDQSFQLMKFVFDMVLHRTVGRLMSAWRFFCFVEGEKQ